MARSWVWYDDHPATKGLTEQELDIQAAKVRVVVDKLNRINQRNEELMWRRQSDEDWDGGFDPDMDEREYLADKTRREFEHEMEQREIDTLYTLLDELGARMMRPYEHWNEDERYMEYMERDRDY